MDRLVTLVVLTAAFAPAAVLGALPLVAPVVGLLLGVLLLVTRHGPAAPATPVTPATPASPEPDPLSKPH